MGNNYTPDNAAASGIAHSYALQGEHVSAHIALVNSAKATGVNTIQQATGYSTAPYKPPRPKEVVEKKKGHGKKPKDYLPRAKLCKANDNTCRGFAIKTGYCAGHSRSMGLIDNWNKDGNYSAEERAKRNLDYKTADEILDSKEAVDTDMFEERGSDPV